MEEYESLLNSAFEKVKQQQTCERFEVRKAEWHVQGKKTIISNFMQISNCLRRDNQEQFTKFLSKELAAQGQIEGDRLILNRVINTTIIDQKIREYAELYIMCQKCKKPDTQEIEENGKKFIRCMACGFRKQI